MGAMPLTFNIYYLQITKIEDLHQADANILHWIQNSKTRTSNGLEKDESKR